MAQIMEYLIPWSEFEKNSHRYGDEGVPYYVVETSSHANYRPKERYVADSLKKAKAHGKGSPYADIEKLVDGAVVGHWGRDPKHPDFLWLGGYGGDERESNPARREIKLWRYDPITGYWRVAQGPFDSADVAAQYLAIFQKDEPGIVFKLSTKRPPYPESSRKRNPGRSSLERESSWVIVNRATGEPILETFQKSVADKVNTKKYEVVPILQWLQRVNRKAREK